jgi:hypothetical protein
MEYQPYVILTNILPNVQGGKNPAGMRHNSKKGAVSQRTGNSG